MSDRGCQGGVIFQAGSEQMCLEGLERVERRGCIRAELWKRTIIPFSPLRENLGQHSGVCSLELCVCV